MKNTLMLMKVRTLHNSTSIVELAGTRRIKGLDNGSYFNTVAYHIMHETKLKRLDDRSVGKRSSDNRGWTVLY